MSVMQLSILILFSLAQQEGLPILMSEDPPPPRDFADKTVYRIEVEGRDEIIQGYIEAPNNEYYTIYLDEPWNPTVRPQNVPQDSIIQQRPETPQDRRERLRRGFEAAGREWINGWWVPKEEAELSRAAHAMYAKQNAPEPADTPELIEAAPIESPVAHTPHPIQRWGLHAAIILVGGAVIWVIIKTMVLSE